MRDTVTLSRITTEVMEPADDVCGSQAPNMFDMKLEIEWAPKYLGKGMHFDYVLSDKTNLKILNSAILTFVLICWWVF